MKLNNMEMSDFYCVGCGQKGLPVWRKRGAARESGHLKRLYCKNCKKEFNHVEVSAFSNYTYEDFLFEKKYNNFDEEGNRIKTFGELRGMVYNGQLKEN